MDASRQGQRTILIVDDVALFRELGAVFLARAGRILTASSGEAALALLREEQPDLVLTDFRMPGMTGETLCATIKRDPDLHEIPVIVMLGQHSGRDHARAVKAGADATLEKPLDRITLVDTVNRFVRFDVARGLPRADVSTPVEIDAGEVQVHGTLRNVSTGGVFIETFSWLARSMEVGLRFKLPNTEELLTPTAQVVWSAEASGHRSTCGLGLQFLDLDRHTRQFLDDYVLERAPLRAPSSL